MGKFAVPVRMARTPLDVVIAGAEQVELELRRRRPLEPQTA